ncbi:hypothetical protein AYL99_05859 [Fonsecaea erecta]|uniref:Uncharacterized protein n=1 Tax=Fonsecaea erecta TaxID=1367422 RepID=A0A178ZM54_9EURO|nr:hypothetical protein AYL99_05859 [Fonsecaea erecta]OAP60857.1 hypothetical protein AYL99_05859 [Fonsecaea erecta]
MESPETHVPPDEVPTQSPQSQDVREDVVHGVVGKVPGSDGKTRPRRPPGRQVKDPLAKSISIQCQRLEDLEAQLKEHLADSAIDREHTTLEFSFPVTTAFMVAAREPLGKRDLSDPKTPYTYSPFNKTAVTVVDVLHSIQDPQERATMQKGISKTLIEACQNVDGYRYSFHNSWVSREDQASRFSYYCNDSVLNKGRAANEATSKMKTGVKVRKPVYDCRGVISIKFSMTKNSLELYYKHIPLHKTFEERAPRPRNGSKRKRLLEIFHPEKLVTEKKRKSSEPRPPKPKKPATRPHSPADTPQREDSLAPLFNFLGRIETAPLPSVTQTVDVDNAIIPTPGDRSKRKKKMYPGTFILDIPNPQRPKPRSKKTRTSAANPAAAPVPATVMSVVPVSSTELELRAKLEQAEQKIRDLEAEKQRQAREHAEPSRPTALQQHQAPNRPSPSTPVTPYAPPPPHTYFPPPQFHYPPHSLQWNYGPPYLYPYPPPGPPSLPYPNPAPGGAPAATHPHAYHYPSQHLPPLSQRRPGPNPPPAYGFVPNPLDATTDPLPMRIRSYLGPPQPPATPDSRPVPRTEPRTEMQPATPTPLSFTEPGSGSPSRPPSTTVPEPPDETASATATAESAQPASKGEKPQAEASTSTTTAEPPATDLDAKSADGPGEK